MEKATFKIHVLLDEHGNASALTDYDEENGCSFYDGLEGGMRAFSIEVTATPPLPAMPETREAVANISVPDEPPQPPAEVTARMA